MTGVTFTPYIASHDWTAWFPELFAQDYEAITTT